MKTTLYLLGLLLLTSNCEYNSLSKAVINKELPGIWTLEQVYANDHWGGALSWKTTNFFKQVKFSTDLKYYSKTNADFQLLGTYKKISDTQFEITWDKPPTPQYPTYLQNFEIDSTGRLTLPTGTFEGIAIEKYKFTEKL